MTRDLIDRLDLFVGSDIELRRLALNMDQVQYYKPPENPAKTTDTRYQAYIAEYGYSSWELDALEPRVLANLVIDFVESILEVGPWNEAMDKENEMKQELKRFADNYR